MTVKKINFEGVFRATVRGRDHAVADGTFVVEGDWFAFTTLDGDRFAGPLASLDSVQK